ncbi:coiled-coil domain-containing protein 148-like [Anguilla rostrata]|uniref:coiled-coil domain-containing protein 148-like n=1 Tax=Anguilla rostrata TaxID=7938 RepID=UPI0030CC7B8E
MGGRDLRMFVTNHRAEDIEKLTLRIKDGLGSTKYKPLQYEQLQPLLDAKRLACARTVQKIQKTQQVAQRTRENTLLRQHREVWIREQAKLMKAGETAEADLVSFLEKNGNSFISQMRDYGLILEREREGFRDATVKPIWQLKEDLQYRLAEVRQHTSQHSIHSQISDWDSVLQEVHSVKDQQEAIAEKLHSECLSLEQEIFALGIEECFSSAQEMLGDLTQVPEEIMSAWCPYPDLKSSLLQEFHALSEKYESKLLTIRKCLQEIGRYCGWPEEDHMVFQMVMSQYPHDLNNYRTLSMDMLQRLLPHRLRQELKDHEQSWDQYRFAQTHQRAVLQSWWQDQAGLLIKSLAILEEARVAHQEELTLQSQRRHQQEISNQLKEKLQLWRAQQEEVARLEAAIASRRQEEEEDRLRREQERDRARRAVQKERVKEFYTEKQRRREEQEKKDQERLEELRELMVEQARRDKERVQFREALLLQRKREREAQALLRLEEEAEKQGHLEALRNQVAVVVEADPERMMGNTKAWQSRHQTGEEFVLQKPLYPLYSFTDRQIVSDPRVRIEQALREAGFHNSPYAREVLSSVHPPRLPRRDTESTIFKS